MKIQRRHFIRQLSLGSAAVAAGFYSRAGAQTNSIAAPPKKLGVALLGLGHYAAGQLAPALRLTNNCELRGVVSGHPGKIARWKSDFSLPDKNCYGYEDFDHIADNPDIDIVYVVTPPGVHAGFAIRAAKAGKHVISEKPMATSVADCEAMIAACKNAKVKLSIGYRLHFDPYLKELMRLQREKDFGEFMTMTGDRGFVFGQHTWRVEKKLAGGGPLPDLGIYLIQAACMATGATPVAVTAHEGPKLRPDFFTDVEETIRFKLEFPNGAVCDAVTSYNHDNDTFHAEGAKGFYEFSAHAFSYKVGTVASSRGPVYFPAPASQQALHMDDFVECIRTGRESEVNGEMGLRDIKIITAIYEAARTGKRVTV
ncbi:MAG TPA: Gfo/Idh/MocA family oxidoreductase [Candidatus Sulfotelmatobacter sp.]|jgi:glucose-fructose oxidoreductase|nr:Gfo/Idh/MocA family oxidoreductase [Candidatus Sulfotelmatobacter sp.]